MAIKLSNGTQPDSLLLLAALANAASELVGLPGMPHDIVVTFGRNGTHAATSRHYTDQALDVRSKTFTTLAAKTTFLRTVIGRLGTPIAVTTPTGEGFMTQNGQWLGILEYLSTRNEHFHLERN